MKYISLLIVTVLSVTFNGVYATYPPIINTEKLLAPYLLIKKEHLSSLILPQVSYQNSFSLLKEKKYVPEFEVPDYDFMYDLPLLEGNFEHIEKFQQIESLYSKKKYEDALLILQTILTDDVRTNQIKLLWQSWIHYGQKDLQQAQKIINEIDLADDFLLTEKYYLLLRVFYDAKEYLSLQDIYEEWTQHPFYDVNLRINHLLFLYYSQNQQWDKASGVSNSFIEKYIFVKNADVFFLNSIIANFYKNDYKTAEKNLSLLEQFSQNKFLLQQATRTVAWLSYYNNFIERAEYYIKKIHNKNSIDVEYLNTLIAHKKGDISIIKKNFSQNNEIYKTYTLFLIIEHWQEFKAVFTLSELIKLVAKEKPEKINKIKRNVAVLLFSAKRFVDAEKQIKTINKSKLSQQKQEDIDILLGITYFHQKKWLLALKQFESPFTIQRYQQEASFFLLQIYYLQKKFDKTLNVFQTINITALTQDKQQFAIFTTSISLYYLQKNKEASDFLIKYWEELEYEKYLTFALQILYKEKNFLKVISLAEKNNNFTSFQLIKLYTLSLLEENTHEKALSFIYDYVNQNTPQEQLLWLQVWANNENNYNVIRQARIWKEQLPNTTEKLSMILYEIKAYQLLQQYEQNIILYDEILNFKLTQNTREKILYNLFLTYRQLTNKEPYFQYTNNILQKNISLELRQKIIVIAAEDRLRNYQTRESVLLYQKYLKFFKPQSEFFLLYFHALYENKQYALCFKNSNQEYKIVQNKDIHLTLLQKIIAARCALALNKLDETKQILQYQYFSEKNAERTFDRQLLLTQLEILKKDFVVAKDRLDWLQDKNLSLKQEQYYKLLSAYISYSKNKYTDVTDAFNTTTLENYSFDNHLLYQALQLNFYAQFFQGNYEKASEQASYILYLPTQRQTLSQNFKLYFTDTLIKLSRLDDAKNIFVQIIPQKVTDQEYYSSIQKILSPQKNNDVTPDHLAQ